MDMFFKTKTDWNLLAKYVSGETDAQERESVLSWAENKPENKALLQAIKSDWQKMDIIDKRFDVDNAWNKLHERITGSESNVINLPSAAIQKSRVGHFSIPVRIAASLILLAILGLALVTATGKLQRITVTSSIAGKDRVVELPDGSKVYLNSDTRLSYSKRFGKNSRDVTLTGEAYFEVTPGKENPFRIYAANACVKVVGTSFNVNTRKTGIVEVYVESGVVELSDNGNRDNKILLHPGNIGVIDNGSVSSLQAKNANSIAWKTGDMTFDDAPIIEVIELLNNVYNVNIHVEGEGVDTIRINGEYQDDTLDEILHVISLHNPQLTIAKSEDTIYLSQ